MRVLILMMVVACAGCAEIQYLDQALTLKGYSDERDAQDRAVKAHDARFEKLLQQSRTPEAFTSYKVKAGIRRAFGEPVICQMEDGAEKCLYRRIVKPLESPKIYFYFNAQGELLRWTNS